MIIVSSFCFSEYFFFIFPDVSYFFFFFFVGAFSFYSFWPFVRCRDKNIFIIFKLFHRSSLHSVFECSNIEFFYSPVNVQGHIETISTKSFSFWRVFMRLTEMNESHFSFSIEKIVSYPKCKYFLLSIRSIFTSYRWMWQMRRKKKKIRKQIIVRFSLRSDVF